MNVNQIIGLIMNEKAPESSKASEASGSSEENKP